MHKHCLLKEFRLNDSSRKHRMHRRGFRGRDVESEKGIGTSELLHRWWGNSAQAPMRVVWSSTYRTLQLLGLCEQGTQERRGGGQYAEVGMTKYGGRRSSVVQR